jgi:3-oxoadipate enol-lactonase/4-carboxymuconolactone decarboxylase
VTPHWQIEGPDDGPVVVLANSLGTDLHVWDAQAAVLSRRLRVVRYDLPGHGATAWRSGDPPLTIEHLAGDVVALLDEVGIERASIAGLSLGGMIAMAVARLAPDRVDRLVLCCTSAHLPPPEAWHERAELVRTQGMSAVVEVVLGRWFTPAYVAAHPAAVERVGSMLLATDPAGYAACCAAIAAMDQRDTLRTIRSPTLVLAGGADPVTPPEHGAAIADRIDGARLVVIEGAAHLAAVERADLVTTAILAHLDPGATLAGAASAITGDRVRREVLGDAHVAAAAARATELTRDFQSWLTRTAWGDVWGRPGLDRRTRSAITVAMLVALGRDEELALHLRAARVNGLSVDELGEILLQSAVYCGVPAANHAFSIAAAVLDEGDR